MFAISLEYDNIKMEQRKNFKFSAFQVSYE